MRPTAIVAVLALATAACGSPDRVGSDVDADPMIAPVESAGTTEPGDTPPEGSATTTTLASSAVAYPEDGQTTPGEKPAVERLSIEDALLPDDALAAPWEPQRRQLDRIGYPAGPNQTDCEPYWEYERLLGGDGGHAMWWVDGGNANHYVIRMADEMAILTNLIVVGSIAEECPLVTWNEGGSFTTELLEFDKAFGLRFDDAESGEVTWVLVTTFGDLVSVLQIPLWTMADGTMIEFSSDDLTGLGDAMYQRLESAGPADERVVVTTTTEPRIVDPPETVVSGLGELLLTDTEAPDGWELDDVDEYIGDASEDVLVENCPAAASIDRIDAVLAWEAEFSSSGGANVLEMIGDIGSSAAATETIREFSLMADCDFGVILPNATTTGGLIEIRGADLAANLVIESPDLNGARLELLVASVGPIIVIVSEEIVAGQANSSVTEFAELGIAKIAVNRG